MSGQERVTERSLAEQGVLCAKCQHVNRHGRSVCAACGAHLHVVCHDCGHRNERARANCVECGHRLHRSWLRRLSRVLGKKNRKVTALQILLLLLGIGFGMAMILLFGNLRWPTL